MAMRMFILRIMEKLGVKVGKKCTNCLI